MAKKISELNPLTVAIDNNGLFEFAQSSASWKITAAQLLDYISYLGSDTQRITFDGTSVVDINIEHITGLYYADFVPNGTPAWQEGRVFWNADDHTFSVYNDVEGVVLQVGQETYLRVRNNTGSQINNGQVVYVSGATGQAATIALAKADNHDACKNIAMATHDIADGQFGYVTVRGLVRGVNTSVFGEGDFVYVSPSVPGGLTNTKPNAPSQVAFVGTVIVDGVNGSILVNPSHHGGLDEMADVSYDGIGSGSVLFYDGLAGYWRPTTLFEIDSTASLLTLNGDLNVTGHSAFGNTAELDTAGFPTYGVVMRIQESTGVWSGGITGLNVALTNTVVGDFATTLGAVIQATGQSSQTGSVTGAVITGSGGTTPDADNIIGVDASAGSAADNSTVAAVIGLDASTSAGFGHVNATVTTMAGGQFQLLEYGSGALSISNAYGILIKTPGFNPTGAITSLYGLYIQDQSTIGAALDHWNVYSAGANSKNYFEGDVYLGDVRLTSDGTAVTFIGDVVVSGDITCDDLFVSAHTIHVGNTTLSDESGFIVKDPDGVAIIQNQYTNNVISQLLLGPTGVGNAYISIQNDLDDPSVLISMTVEGNQQFRALATTTSIAYAGSHVFGTLIDDTVYGAGTLDKAFALYLGGVTDGCWRSLVSSDDLIFETRTASVWGTKQTLKSDGGFEVAYINVNTIVGLDSTTVTFLSDIVCTDLYADGFILNNYAVSNISNDRVLEENSHSLVTEYAAKKYYDIGVDARVTSHLDHYKFGYGPTKTMIKNLDVSYQFDGERTLDTGTTMQCGFVAPFGNADVFVAGYKESGGGEGLNTLRLLTYDGTTVVNTLVLTTTGHDTFPIHGAITQSGKLVVVYTKSDFEIYMRMFDPYTLTEILAEQAITTATSSIYPKVVILANGNILIIWTDSVGLLFTIVNEEGDIVVAQTRCANSVAYNNHYSFGSLQNGNFAISYNENASNGRYYTNVYSPDGTLINSVLTQNNSNDVSQSKLIPLVEGNFIVQHHHLGNTIVMAKHSGTDGSVIDVESFVPFASGGYASNNQLGFALPDGGFGFFFERSDPNGEALTIRNADMSPHASMGGLEYINYNYIGLYLPTSACATAYNGTVRLFMTSTTRISADILRLDHGIAAETKELLTTVESRRSGQESITTDATSITVVFSMDELDTNYYPICSIENTVDAPPSFYSLVITNKTTSGFTVLFDASIDSNNYKLNWRIGR